MQVDVSFSLDLKSKNLLQINTRKIKNDAQEESKIREALEKSTNWAEIRLTG